MVEVERTFWDEIRIEEVVNGGAILERNRDQGLKVSFQEVLKQQSQGGQQKCAVASGKGWFDTFR